MKPFYYEIFVDDIFLLFGKPEQVLPFVNYMMKMFNNITFCFNLKRFSFLDVKLCREKG